jgi:hypothetical protein
MNMKDLDNTQRPALRSTLTRSALIIACGLALTAGCSTTPHMDVGSAYGPGVRFDENGSTYAWMSDALPVTGNPQLDNPSLHHLIRQTVDDRVAAKGYKKVSRESANFWIDYRLGAEQRGDPDGIQEEIFTEYTEGTLALYVIDPATRKWIWRAWAQAKVHEDDVPNARKVRIEEAIRRMLEKVRSKTPST